MSTARSIVAVLLAFLGVVSACTQPPGTPESQEGVVVQAADPSFVHGTDGGGIDRLAATVVTEVQAYWARQFPADFGAPWRDLDGGFFSVDTTTSTDGRPPPCSGDAKEVEGNAYFCASVDAIAWDRSALLPVLRERYGEASVAVVLAHEIGHAVQQRSGMDLNASDQPVRTEAMADCYAGSFVRWVADGRSARLRISPAQRDAALRALNVFRDPIGTAASDADAHGTAFDRVSAFQDGYRDGSRRCSAVGEETRKLTDLEPDEGNRSVDDIARSPEAGAFFDRLVTERGRPWAPPPLRWSTEPAGQCSLTPAPVVYCARPPTVVVDRDAIGTLHRDIGDHATTTLLASRYAVAALAALGRPLRGTEAGRQAVCLSGAYTGSLAHRSGAPLSAADLDEALEVLLAEGSASADAAGTTSLSGFDRVAAFRAGAFGGVAACGV